MLLLLLHLQAFLLEQVVLVELLLEQLLLMELSLLVELDLLLGASSLRAYLQHVGRDAFIGYNEAKISKIID